MSKKQRHQQDLILLFDAYAASGNADALTGYMFSHSNLPGRRANLELADAFGDLIAERKVSGIEGKPGLWALCRTLAAISANDAPVNSSEGFLPFCGAVGIGAIGSVSPEHSEEALAILRRIAEDPRWRIREAVCFGLQRMLEKRAPDTLQALYGWVGGGEPLQMRAAAAAVAEPTFLAREGMAQAALNLHRPIFERVMAATERRSEGFKTLRKALGYTLSVVVEALPGEGFDYMAQLAESGDADVVWIVKQNLKKNRLVKRYPEAVDTTSLLLK